MSFIVIQAFSQKKQLKSITEIKYNKNDEPVHKTVKEFNEDSVMIKNSYYNGDFDLVSFVTYTSTVNNESTEISYDKNSKIQELDTIRYDDNGEIIYYSRKHTTRPAGSNFYVDVYRFEYDGNGNIIKEYREENGLPGGWIYDYEYNDENQKIKMLSSYNNVPGEEYTFKYEEGNLVERKLYDFNNEELKKADNTYWYYKYKDGKRVSEKVHSVAAYLGRIIINFETYTYNKDGFLKEEIMFEDGEYDGKRVYSYTFHKK